jgi:methyl-accepting chemotaxis protein
MLKNITIKARLVAILSFLLLACVLIGVGGLVSLASVNASLKTVYEDRLIALGQLDRVVRLANRHQLMLAKALTDEPAKVKVAMDGIEKDIGDGDKVWATYLATFLTPDEKTLSTDMDGKRKIFIQQGVQPAVAALRGGDVAAATTMVHGIVDQHYTAMRAPLSKLIELQLAVGKHEYEEGQKHFIEFRNLTIGAIVLATVLGIIAGVWLVRSITAPLSVAIRTAGEIAGGNLAQQIEVDSTNEMGQLLKALKDMGAALTTTVSEVRASSDTIATASAEIAAGNLDLSSRTEEQAASLEETASSMEELTSTVKQNADNARSANQLVIAASSHAEESGAAVSRVVATMGDIKDSSRKISDIIGVIDGIAFQTNILALNAAVEAARAGEQGRGFAVVATEVRNLAQRSASAAKEIKVLINDSVEKVDAGGLQVDAAGETIRKVVVSVKEVSDIMAEISAASQEQSSGIEQINLAVVQMDQVTQQNAALVEESAAAAASLQEQAAGLAASVRVFVLPASASTPTMATRRTASAPARPVPARKAAPVARIGRARASATEGSDWESF